MQTVDEMLRSYNGLVETDIMRRFNTPNASGYASAWLCRIVYNSSGYSPDRPIVEFYSLDTNQFVSDYYVGTLLGEDEFFPAPVSGLDLHGGIRSWTIDAAGMEQILEWLWDLHSNGEI